jgi:hypothetical protein
MWQVRGIAHTEPTAHHSGMNVVRHSTMISQSFVAGIPTANFGPGKWSPRILLTSTLRSRSATKASRSTPS